MSSPAHDRPSKRQKMDGDSTAAVIADDGIVCRHDEVKWLISNFSGTRSICVKFGVDDRQYFFSEKVLIDNFRYFESALRRDEDQPVFIEGRTDCVHLEDITTRAFSRLFRFVGTQPYVYNDCADMDHLLDAILAADYLGLKNFAQHEVHIVERLRLLLLEDRRRLTAAHLELVATHNAFKNTRVWRTFAKAGVKPFLQESMLELEYTSEKGKKHGRDTTFPGRAPYGEGYFPEVWKSILEHCRDLRRSNKDYAADVMEQLSKTLKRGREDIFGGHDSHTYCEEGHMPALSYSDPLRKEHVAGAHCIDLGSDDVFKGFII